jgi:4-aminobutyrate aminotransferase-like enzyme
MLNPMMQIHYPTEPLKIVKGEMQYLIDEDGNKYLDCANNVCHVGHCHPEVVEKVNN